jgi:hypothetical protein
MTAALLSDEHAADMLVQASDTGDAAALAAQVVQFRRHTARVTSAAQLVSKVSHDAKRVSFVEATADHLTQVSNQLVNASLLTVEAPTDQDVRRQRDLLKRSYNGDLGTLKNSVNEMVDTQVCPRGRERARASSDPTRRVVCRRVRTTAAHLLVSIRAGIRS